MPEEYSTIAADKLQIKIYNPATKKEIASFTSRIAIVSWVELKDPDNPKGPGEVKTLAAGNIVEVNGLINHIIEYVRNGFKLAARTNKDKQDDITN